MEIDDNEDDNTMDNIDPEQRGPGRPKSNVESQTDEIMDNFRNIATEMGMSVCDLLLFYGQKEAEKNGDILLTELFKQLNRLKVNGEPKLSPLKALALKKKLVMGRNKYQELINMLGHHNVLPSKNKVKQYEDSIKIELTPFLGGYKANLKDVLAKTIQRILQLKNYKGSSKKLKVKFSGGLDGSGSHIQRAGKMSTVNTKVRSILRNYFQDMYALNILKD